MFYNPIIFLAFALLSAKAPLFEEQILDADVAIGYGLAIGDVDGDGKSDVLLADKKAIVWYRNGDWKKHVMAENLTTSDNVCIAAMDLMATAKSRWLWVPNGIREKASGRFTNNLRIYWNKSN